MYAAMSRSRRAHLATGTVQVTAVGMFADGGGFAIAPPTLASLLVVVGGVSRRPRAIGDRIEVRDVLDLTVTIDHNVVDGQPATRFAADLRQVTAHRCRPSRRHRIGSPARALRHRRARVRTDLRHLAAYRAHASHPNNTVEDEDIPTMPR